MSDSGYEQRERGPGGDDVQFVERDDTKTTLDYDDGGVPVYITVAWVVFIVAYVLVMSLVALPDLLEWIRH